MRRRDILLAAAALPAAAWAQAVRPTRFSVRTTGQGPDVVLIPGLMCSGEVWDETTARLAGRRRVHVLTVAGFAGTPAGGAAKGEVIAPLAEEVAAYIRGESLKDVAIIGHSIGGLTGQLVAGRHPDLVSRLMVVDALPLYWLLAGPQATVEGFRSRSVAMRDSILAMSPEQFAAGQRASVAGMTKSKAGQDKILRWSLSSDRSVAARAMFDANTIDARPLLPAIKARTTVLYAYDRSAPYPAQNFDAIYGAAYAGLPNKRLVRIDDSLHFIMYDQPQAFEREVDAFLA